MEIGGTFWLNWCRLCSKSSDHNNYLDISSKSFRDEESLNVYNLKEIIEKHFPILIANSEEISKKICVDCYKFINNLQKFSDRAAKVETMFSELIRQKICIVGSNNIESIRKQYGIRCNIDYDKCDQCTDTNDLTIEILDGNHSESFVKLEPPEDNLYEHYKVIDNENNCDDDSKELTSNTSVCVVIKTENDCFEPEENNEISEEKIKKRTTRNSRGERKKLHANLSNKNVDYDEKYSNSEEYDSYSNDSYDSYERKQKTKKKKPEKKINICSEENKQKRRARRLIELEGNTNLKCEICNKIFSRQYSLRYHMQNIHAKPEDMKFVCSHCDRTFPTERSLRGHELTHLPPGEKLMYPCPYCDKKFTKSVNVNPHIRAIHIGEKSFICEECGKTFVTKGALKEHSYTHIDETPFQCSKCPKKFKNQARLKVHEDTHTGTTYVCPICGLQLNTKRTLNSHMIIHSDAKKYKCEYCGNEFKRSKTLKNHLILHTGLRPYTCPFCDKTFANGSNCRSHKKKAHPVELAALEMAGDGSTPAVNIPRLDQLKAVAAQASPLTLTQPQQKIKIEKSQQLQIFQHQQNDLQQQHLQQLTPINYEQDSSNISHASFSQDHQSASQMSVNYQADSPQSSANNSLQLINEAQRNAAIAAAAASVGFPSSHSSLQGYHNLPREINEQMQLHRQNIYEHLKLALS